MTPDHDRLVALVAALRADGLDVRMDEQSRTIVVGTALRGPEAAPASIVIDEGLLDEYVDDLARRGPGYDGRTDHAFGYLITLVLESVTAVHLGGQSNLVTEVRLQRGASGHLGLSETRKAGRGAPPLPDGGRYMWTAERPGD